MLFSVRQQAIPHAKSYVLWGVILLSLTAVGTVSMPTDNGTKSGGPWRMSRGFDSDKKGTAINFEADYKETVGISRYKICKCILRERNCDVNSMDWRKLLCG